MKKSKVKNQNEYLDHLRHSCAHLLAASVLELFPRVKNAIGPSIENGFYQDFDFSQCSKQVSEADLPKIEKAMLKKLKTWDSFEINEVPVAQAKKDFAWNPYKVELIEEFASQGKTITETKQGEFLDLCKGGHVDDLQKELKHFKLLSIAGAYWRGSEKNQMLTRIYGTAWPTKEELENYLKAVEEAKENDHRKLGQELDLFAIDTENVGPGLILWLPKGTILKEELEKFGKETEKKWGYQRISTPHIAKEQLYLTSGHLPYYAADMFAPMKTEDANYYLKPMNCPHMYMAYKARPHTYKELPIRYAEFGTVYRYEDSGTLMGLLRVRGLTQNDAHIFCTEEQAVDELVKVMELHDFYYKAFGLKNYYIELALPDLKSKKDKYFDDPREWNKAVKVLREAAKAAKVDVVEKVGEAAFYGPKFDFNFKSVTGREFGASTNQLDFGAGKRFSLSYRDRDGQDKIVPFVIHRAPLGSNERFIGFLIEHFGGAFPVWMSPVQAVIIPLSDKNINYAQFLNHKFNEADLRCEVDSRSQTLQARIRDAQLQKVPYMLIVGNREEENKTIAVRLRTGEDLGALTFEELLGRIKKNVEAKKGL